MRERREEIQTQKLKNTCLLCRNLEKPSQLQELTQTRWVSPKKNRSYLDCHRFETWIRCGTFLMKEIKQVSDLYEGPPPTVDFRSSKCCHENGPASSYTAACCSFWWSPVQCDKSQICKWQSNCELSGTDEPVFLLSPCFIRAAYCGFILHNNLAG